MKAMSQLARTLHQTRGRYVSISRYLYTKGNILIGVPLKAVTKQGLLVSLVVSQITG